MQEPTKVTALREFVNKNGSLRKAAYKLGYANHSPIVRALRGSYVEGPYKRLEAYRANP